MLCHPYSDILSGFLLIPRLYCTYEPSSECNEPHERNWAELIMFVYINNTLLWIQYRKPEQNGRIWKELFLDTWHFKGSFLFKFQKISSLTISKYLFIKSSLVQVMAWHRIDEKNISWTNNPVQWASCQIRKIAGTHVPGMPGTFFPPPQVSDPDMHHGTCVTHVPWCMPGSLISGYRWSRRGKNILRIW